jgi:hypothetical protein
MEGENLERLIPETLKARWQREQEMKKRLAALEAGDSSRKPTENFHGQ